MSKIDAWIFRHRLTKQETHVWPGLLFSIQLLFNWSIYDSCNTYAISSSAITCEFRSGRFSNFRGLSAIVSFLSPPLPSTSSSSSSFKDGLSFVSLSRQLDAGLKAGYKANEIIDAVIRAVSPSLQLSSYLEMIQDLT